MRRIILGGVYFVDIIIEEVENHMSYEGVVRESFPLDYDYEEPTLIEHERCPPLSSMSGLVTKGLIIL